MNTGILSVGNQLTLAKSIANEFHLGQFRKGGNDVPYIVHPERVAKRMAERYPIEPSYQIVAWLHDVLEDTDCTREYLLSKGIGEEYIVMVEHLSRKKNETYYDFIMRMRYSHMPRKVKIADIEDNLSDNLSEGSLKDKYRLSLYILSEFEKEFENKPKKQKSNAIDPLI